MSHSIENKLKVLINTKKTTSNLSLSASKVSIKGIVWLFGKVHMNLYTKHDATSSRPLAYFSITTVNGEKLSC